MTILYVCDACHQNWAEGCGRIDRQELRVMPNGQWLCEDCYDNSNEGDIGMDGHEDAEMPDWSTLSVPPEYKPAASEQ